MRLQKEAVHRQWFKAKLTPMAVGLFTDSFYPTPKRGTNAQHVYFTQVSDDNTCKKIIVASKLCESGLRMMTKDLALNCLIPGDKATKAEMQTLNEISKNLKV
jgi:hypothetical protein